MRERTFYCIIGILGMAALGGSIAAGHWQDRVQPGQGNKVTNGSNVSDRQLLERRRARVADVAIAGTTTQ